MYFCTRKASKLTVKPLRRRKGLGRSAAAASVLALFCTSKASKVSTVEHEVEKVDGAGVRVREDTEQRLLQERRRVSLNNHLAVVGVRVAFGGRQ